MDDFDKWFNEFITASDDIERAKVFGRMSLGLNGHKVKDECYEVKVGDKVLITNFCNSIPSNVVAKLAREKYCIVESSFPVPIGSDGDYHFEYEISVEGGEGYTIMQSDYHVLSKEEINKLDNGFKI